MDKWGHNSDPDKLTINSLLPNWFVGDQYILSQRPYDQHNQEPIKGILVTLNWDENPIAKVMVVLFLILGIVILLCVLVPKIEVSKVYFCMANTHTVTL